MFLSRTLPEKVAAFSRMFGPACAEPSLRLFAIIMESLALSTGWAGDFEKFADTVDGSFYWWEGRNQQQSC
jgi:hypothetical protein